MPYFKLHTFLSLLLILITLSGHADAAPSEYLKYQEPQPAASSSFSTFSYIISLIITFAVVICLAYITSRFLGQRMGKLGTIGDNRILITFPLGSNKSVQVVEIAGKYLIIGVTDQTINLLLEITDPNDIEKLKAVTPTRQPASPFEQVFETHLNSLQSMSQKFPGVFKSNANTDENEGKR